ncbi:MAG: MAPEG family protein [Legionellaceae bacterium]|nr:MAPEG family protein [Legionellaceae bacterium]
MTTLIICLYVMILLPYIAKAPLAYAMKQQGGYDNRYPRSQQAALVGFGARCNAAHHNCFEALLVFGIVALVAMVTNKVSMTVQYLAIAYVVSRIVYLFMYWLDYPALRSTVWFVGLILALSILTLSI